MGDPNHGSSKRLRLVRSTANTTAAMTAAFAAMYNNLCSVSLKSAEMVTTTKRSAEAKRVDRIIVLQEGFGPPGDTLKHRSGR